MKKNLLLFVFAITLYSSAIAQEFRPFRVGLGTGFASPSGEGAKGGVLLYLEPSYRINSAIAVGLRAELAVMARGTILSSGANSTADFDVSANGSYTLNGQYYFSNRGFRPFVGAGFGVYTLASQKVKSFSNGSTSVSTTGGEISGGTKFGFYPRVGFDAGHFTFNIEYNIIPKSTNSFTYDSNGVQTNGKSETKNNYLGIKLGFFIGGGRI